MLMISSVETHIGFLNQTIYGDTEQWLEESESGGYLGQEPSKQTSQQVQRP